MFHERRKFPKERLAVTVFKGNDFIPEDTESIEIWKSLGMSEDRIAKTFLKKYSSSCR